MFFVTRNKNKLREFEEILETKFEQIELDLDEIQEIDVQKVIEHKAREAYAKTKEPAIVEDTGLYFEAWNDLPGALIKWFEKAVGYEKLAQMLGEDRRAKAQTVIGYYDGKNHKNFSGEIQGSIAPEPRGQTGFGWDIIFIPKGHEKTFAEMGPEEKNKISMRRIAIEHLKKFLDK
jgi:XTP/dITP diphosphohydrolase